MPKPYFEDKSSVESIIRVNHAGEHGAQCIYKGQIKYAKNDHQKKVFQEMLSQEMEHLEYFESLIKFGYAKPTLFLPIWSVLGNFAGVISQKMGYKYSMIVTEAVEEVIVDHYQKQIEYLAKHAPNSELLSKIRKFQQDEADHIEIATATQDASNDNIIVDSSLKKIVSTFCHIAILLSKRL
ncbi:MAG TPA: demethoxyubiquinone hydroxylase family protein [Candidatus Megaira endosymbiont of Nemacystus decipiens]|nr:demethoxyubiquinone hydroxylase family protein [Candidatus Megaera endosymbiont of Nemacystus decipiens]